MKVGSLMYELNKFNPNAEIRLANGDDILLSYISEGNASKRTTKQVFIESIEFCESCAWHDGGGFCDAYKMRIEDIENCIKYKED